MDHDRLFKELLSTFFLDFLEGGEGAVPRKAPDLLDSRRNAAVGFRKH
jgi:hypothetical protein